MQSAQKQGVKRTHSGKKPKKETVKQVLTTPFTPYWPLITEQQLKILEKALDKSLPVTEQEKTEKPHWNVLKELTKEQRKQLQKPNPAVKKGYAFGVNEITKLLEKSAAQAVLIASDVSPRLLVKHVMDMCVIKNVPVLVVPQLREVLKQRAGMSAVAFGVKDDGDLLAQTVKNIHMNYPVPEDHIHSFRRQECEGIENKEAVDVEMEVETCREMVERKELFLRRASKTERAFKAESSESAAAIVSVPAKGQGDVGFLCLEESVGKTVKKVNYKALIVKRLKGNKEREKRKKEIAGHKK